LANETENGFWEYSSVSVERITVDTLVPGRKQLRFDDLLEGGFGVSLRFHHLHLPTRPRKRAFARIKATTRGAAKCVSQSSTNIQVACEDRPPDRELAFCC